MRLLDGINTLQEIVLFGLSLVVFAVEMYALIDALRQKTAAFPAAGKLTKPLWLLILGIAAAVGFVCIGLEALFFLNIAGVVAAGVYLADVKPAVSRYSGRGGNSGPYGSW
jgi:hypothetical protein